MRRRALWNLSCSRANIPGNWRHKRVSGRADPSCVYTQTFLCTHSRCVCTRKDGRAFSPPPPSLSLFLSLYVCVHSFSSRPYLHQEGKKKLIPDPFTTRTQQRHSTKGRNTLRKLRLTCTITFRKRTWSCQHSIYYLQNTKEISILIW